MANRIRGITVEIGGDTTKLSKALEGVNKTIKNTQTQLKDVEKLLKLDPKNTELLSQKQKLLADSISATKDKLATLKTAAEQANAALANPCYTETALTERLSVILMQSAEEPCFVFLFLSAVQYTLSPVSAWFLRQSVLHLTYPLRQHTLHSVQDLKALNCYNM